MLRLPASPAKIRSDDRFPVGFAVVVGIFPECELRRFADENSAAKGKHRSGHDEPVEKHLRFVHPPVAVGIGEPLDSTDRLVLAVAVGILHVAAHLDDIHSPKLVKRNRDRIFDHRLTRDWLNDEPLGQRKRLQRRLHIQWIGRWKIETESEHPPAGVGRMSLKIPGVVAGGRNRVGGLLVRLVAPKPSAFRPPVSRPVPWRGFGFRLLGGQHRRIPHLSFGAGERIPMLRDSAAGIIAPSAITNRYFNTSGVPG